MGIALPHRIVEQQDPMHSERVPSRGRDPCCSLLIERRFLVTGLLESLLGDGGDVGEGLLVLVGDGGKDLAVELDAGKL